MHDPVYRRQHTYSAFLEASVPEWTSLPLPMQNDLVAEFNGMVRRGEFDPNQFVPDPAKPDPVATVTAPAVPSPPPTAEQLQAYESMRRKLQDPGFTQSRTLAELAALPEVQIVTPAQRRQLQREALGMLQRGELSVLTGESAAGP
jgi:hypothetical protein